MVKRSEIGVLGAALRGSHGISAESEVLGLSSRVRRAASSLQMQSEETVLASYGPTKTAILTMLPLEAHGAHLLADGQDVGVGERRRALGGLSGQTMCKMVSEPCRQ